MDNSSLQNNLGAQMREFASDIDKLSGKPIKIKNMADLHITKTKIMENILSIIDGKENPVNISLYDGYKLTTEAMYNSALNDFIESIYKENSNLFDELENIIKTDVTNGHFWGICNKINDKVGNSGVKDFDNMIHSYISETIGAMFEENRKTIIDTIVKKYDYSKVDTLKSAFASFENVQYIKPEFFDEIRKGLADKYIQEVFPNLKKQIDEICTNIEEKIKNNDIIGFDIALIKNTFDDSIREIKNNIESGSGLEEQLKKVTDEFETRLNHYIVDIIESYFNQKILKDIEEFDSKNDFDEYEKTPGFISWIEKINYFSEILLSEKLADPETAKKDGKKLTKEDIKKDILIEYEDLKKGIILKNVGKIIPIKQKGGMVYFGDIEFPIYTRKKQKGFWKLDPKIIGEHVTLNIKEQKAKTIIKPEDSKKIRINNPYEVTRDEYKKMIQDFEEFKKNYNYTELLNSKKESIEKLDALRLKYKESPDSAELKTEINKIEVALEEINAKIKKGVPHIFRLIERLNKFNLSNYGGVPELSPKIKITPDVLNNIKKVVFLAKDQLIRQDGIGILEGEAGVGKNVLIDIFAHYTNRPVFTFPCNKRASKEDLTYQWLIDENGTYKLHSKVYEAIKTSGAILIFDEINTLPPEVIKVLNGLFDYRRTLTMPYDNEYEKAQDDAIIFGTQNPTHYDGTQKLPQDTLSRSTIAYIDYPGLDTIREGVPFVTFDEGLITYANMPYYYKLLEIKGYDKETIKKINSLKLRKKSGQKLSIEEQSEIDKFEKNILTEQEFVDAWNNIFNLDKEQEMIEGFGPEFVQGIKDIYTIIKMAYKIRERYRLKREGINKQDTVIEVSVSQRELNKMMGQLCEGKTPKQAFIDIYVPMISNMISRTKVKADLESMNI